MQNRISCAVTITALSFALTVPAMAQKKYDTGATDTEIKVGNIMPYSGPVSSLGIYGKTEDAYFKKINDQGGINGRKINFISYDDGYSPPKTIEQTRKLVEGDEVLLMFNPLGTAGNVAIQKYMNSRKVPQLFVASGASKWDDPKNFPWTIGFSPSFRLEARIFARYVLDNLPNGKLAILYQNDEAGKDQLTGFKEELGERADAIIVAPKSYESTDPTIDSQIVAMKSSGADIFYCGATPKFCAQAIKKVAELGWKPVFLLSSPASSIGSVLKPAGLENSVGIISTAHLKDPSDPAWKDDAGVKRFLDFMAKYYPAGDTKDPGTAYAYTVAQTLAQTLKQCGDDLTRDNVMRQAASLNDVPLDMLLPGIKIHTSADSYAPIQQLQLIKFDGASWQRFGGIVSLKSTSAKTE
jgi:branched-chain amino acid transport system substrate-binding protein